MLSDLMGGDDDEYGDEYGDYGDETAAGSQRVAENAMDDFM